MGKRISQALQLAPSTPALRPVYPQLPGTQSHPFTCQNHIRFHGVDHFIILYVFHLRKHLVADIIYSSGRRHFLAYSFLPHDEITSYKQYQNIKNPSAIMFFVSNPISIAPSIIPAVTPVM